MLKSKAGRAVVWTLDNKWVFGVAILVVFVLALVFGGK